MPIGDFGNFGNWKPKDHALNKIIYDEAHKKSSGPSGGNTGCFCVFIVVFVITFICVAFILM